ncbi:MAG: hypothetical protein QM739_21210 [Propionivibrio sp.]
MAVYLRHFSNSCKKFANRWPSSQETEEKQGVFTPPKSFNHGLRPATARDDDEGNLPVARTKILVYVLSGFCSSLGGVLVTLYMQSGYGLHALDAIAAAVIGGTLLTGGGDPVNRSFLNTVQNLTKPRSLISQVEQGINDPPHGRRKLAYPPACDWPAHRTGGSATEVSVALAVAAAPGFPGVEGRCRPAGASALQPSAACTVSRVSKTMVPFFWATIFTRSALNSST